MSGESHESTPLGRLVVLSEQQRQGLKAMWIESVEALFSALVAWGCSEPETELPGFDLQDRERILEEVRTLLGPGAIKALMDTRPGGSTGALRPKGEAPAVDRERRGASE